MKKRHRIDAKSMLEKVMRKVWKIMPKGNQNGSQNLLKSVRMPEKRHANNYTKKDAKNDPEMNNKGTKGEAPGG